MLKSIKYIQIPKKKRNPNSEHFSVPKKIIIYHSGLLSGNKRVTYLAGECSKKKKPIRPCKVNCWNTPVSCFPCITCIPLNCCCISHVNWMWKWTSFIVLLSSALIQDWAPHVKHTKSSKVHKSGNNERPNGVMDCSSFTSDESERQGKGYSRDKS